MAVTHKRIQRLLIKLARCAWALADGTEDSNEEFLRVDRKDFDALSKALDKLDALPELPPPYFGTGPAKAEHHLGLANQFHKVKTQRKNS